MSRGLFYLGLQALRSRAPAAQTRAFSGPARRFFSSDDSTIPFFAAVANVLSAADVKGASIVTGGGVASFTGHLDAIGGIKTTSSSSELATVGYAVGRTRTLRSRGAAGGTLGVGVAQQIDELDYLSRGHALSSVVIVGDNSDGKTGPASFQPVDVKQRYWRMLNGNVIKLVSGPSKDLHNPLNMLNLHGQLAKLSWKLEEAYVAGEPVLVSVPQNMAQHPVLINPADREALKRPVGYSRPRGLSADADAQLNELAAAVNAKDARVLFVSGEGLGHAIRLEGNEVHELAGAVMQQMVGNRVTTSDWADMRHGHKHELPPTSHNYDGKIQKGIEQANVVIFIGCGPNATLTGLQNGLQHYTRKKTQCFMIDSSQSRLDKWSGEPDLARANMTYIHAPIKDALENLYNRQWQNTATRNLEAERIAADVRKAVFEGPQEVLGAQKMRDIAIAITQVLETEEQGRNIGLSVSSGDASSIAGLRHRTIPVKPGNLFYPNEGMLGVTLSAARGMADTGGYDHVVAFVGDGEMGYTALELGYTAEAACPITTIVFNNGRWGAVDKAQRPGIEGRIIENMQRYGTMPNTNFANIAGVFPDAGIRKFSVDGNNPQSVARAVKEALGYKGASIVDVNIRDIEREQVLGQSR